MNFLIEYVVAAVIFVAIDVVWLTLIAGKMYKKELGYLLAKKPDLIAAALFYALYIGGIVFFALDPALARDSLGYAVWAGSFLGLLMYATYDLTNQATIKKWPRKITVIDLLWGTFVTGFVTTICFLIFR